MYIPVIVILLFQDTEIILTIKVIFTRSSYRGIGL